MPPIRRSSFALAPIMLLLAHSAADADYMSVTAWADGETAVGGLVQIEAYDGKGPAGGGLSAGQVRVTVAASVFVPPPPVFGFPGDFRYQYSGLQDFSFPTDLNLTPNQITAPANWSVAGIQAVSYPFPFVVDVSANTESAYQGQVSVLISGLGADATPGHFLFPDVWGGGFGLGWNFADPVPITSAPEPSSLVLCVVGVAGLLGRRGLRLGQ